MSKEGETLYRNASRHIYGGNLKVVGTLNPCEKVVIMVTIFPRKKPAHSTGSETTRTNPSPPGEPFSPIEHTSEPSMWEPGAIGFVIEGSEGENSPIHSRHSSAVGETTNPFEEIIRAQSPQPARPSRLRPAPPTFSPPPELQHLSRSPEEPNSRFVSIMPGGLDVVNMEEKPDVTDQKDTWGSHTVYTFRVRARQGSDSAGAFQTVRRFREFVLLRQEMMEHWPGVYVPPLPPKKAFVRFT